MVIHLTLSQFDLEYSCMTKVHIMDTARVFLVSVKKTLRQYQTSSLSTLSQQSMNIALSKAAVEPWGLTVNWACEPAFNASPRKPRLNPPIGVLLMTGPFPWPIDLRMISDWRVPWLRVAHRRVHSDETIWDLNQDTQTSCHLRDRDHSMRNKVFHAFFKE